MAKWTVDMIYGTNVRVTVEAETGEEAQQKARELADDNVMISTQDSCIEAGNLEYKDTTFLEGV